MLWLKVRFIINTNNVFAYNTKLVYIIYYLFFIDNQI
jgi:hypothetical protein